MFVELTRPSGDTIWVQGHKVVSLEPNGENTWVTLDTLRDFIVRGKPSVVAASIRDAVYLHESLVEQARAAVHLP